MTLHSNHNTTNKINSHRTAVSRGKNALACTLWPILVIAVVLSFSNSRWSSAGRGFGDHDKVTGTGTRSRGGAPEDGEEAGKRGDVPERIGQPLLPQFANLAVRRWATANGAEPATLLVPVHRGNWASKVNNVATTTAAAPLNSTRTRSDEVGDQIPRYFERLRECVSPTWCRKLRWGKFSLFHSVPLPLDVCLETFVLAADPCVVAVADHAPDRNDSRRGSSASDTSSTPLSSSSLSPAVHEVESTCSCEQHRPGVYHNVFLHVATPEPHFGISKFTPVVALTWARLLPERPSGVPHGGCEHDDEGCRSDGRRVLALIDKSNSLLHFQRCLGNFEILGPLFRAAASVRASVMLTVQEPTNLALPPTSERSGATMPNKETNEKEHYRNDDVKPTRAGAVRGIPTGYFVADPLSRVAGHALEKILEALGQYVASDELSGVRNRVPWLLPTTNHGGDGQLAPHAFDTFESFVVEITEALGIPLVRFPFDTTVLVERFVAPHYENGENGLCWRSRALDILRPLAVKASSSAPSSSRFLPSPLPRRVALIKFDHTVNVSSSPDRAFRASSRFTQLLRTHNVTLLNNTMKLLPRMHALNEAELIVTTWGSTFTTTMLLLQSRKSSAVRDVALRTAVTTASDGTFKDLVSTNSKQKPLLLVVLIHPGYLQEARRIFHIHGLVKAKVWKVDISKRRADYRENISWRTTFVDYNGGPGFCVRFITTPSLRYVNDADLSDPCKL